MNIGIYQKNITFGFLDYQDWDAWIKMHDFPHDSPSQEESSRLTPTRKNSTRSSAELRFWKPISVIINDIFITFGLSRRGEHKNDNFLDKSASNENLLIATFPKKSEAGIIELTWNAEIRQK